MDEKLPTRTMRFSFTLRTVFIVVTAICILAAVGTRYFYDESKQIDLIRHVEALGGTALTIEEVDGSSKTGNHTPLLAIDLSLPYVDDAAMKLFARQSDVGQLSVIHSQITDATLRIIGTMPRLRRLNLSYTSITDSGLTFLGNTEIEEVSLRGVHVNGTGLRNLLAAARTRTLDLSQTEITDSALLELSRLGAVCEWFLADNRLSFVPESILRTAEVLDVSRTSVTDQTLGQLGCAAHLRMFAAAGTNVGDGTLERLVKLSEVTSLNLEDSRITDAGFSQFLRTSASRKLIELRLDATHVGDLTAQALRTQANLSRVSLRKSAMSPDAVRGLQRSLGGALIDW